MEKRNMVFLTVLISLLAACIALMCVSLLVGERVFGQVSGYIAIIAIAITLIGVVFLMIFNRRNKK